MKPQGVCLAHLERTGKRIPEFQIGLCEDCYKGKPIHPKEEMQGSRYWETDARKVLKFTQIDIPQPYGHKVV